MVWGCLVNRHGRPRKPNPILPSLPARAEEINLNITLFLDKVMSVCYKILAMAFHTDTANQMKKRLLYECQGVQENRKKMEKIADSYNRYLDLLADQKRKLVRIRRIATMLESGEMLNGALEQDRGAIDEALGTDALSAIFGIDELPLWEAMKEYLLYVEEARIDEIVSFLSRLKMKTANRQAIESALKKHRETFETHKKGSEKYISLKDGIKA